jgi:threonine-phosphate decarboxylase
MALEKNAIFRRLQKIEWIRVFETDSNMILLKIDNNPDEVEHELRRAGLDIRRCGDINGLDSSFFRISVMKHENNLKLLSVLSRLHQEGIVTKAR